MDFLNFGSSLFGSAVSSISTAVQNRKNRDWQEKMYARQLADERESWMMQNDYNEEMYNKYNSPAAQSRQMLAAGINPDMQELSGNTLSPSSALGSASVPSVSGQNPIDFVGAFMNIAEMINSVRSSELDNELKEAELQKLSQTHAMDYMIKNYELYKDVYKDAKGTNTMGELFDASMSSSNNLWKYFEKQGLSKRSAKLAARYVMTMDVDKLHNEYYTRQSAKDTSRKAYALGKADPYYKNNDDDFITALNEFLSRSDEFDRLMQKANNNVNKYKADYYSSKNGSVDAYNEQRISSASAEVAESKAADVHNQKELNEDINKFVDSFDSDWARSIARLVVYVLKNTSFGSK